MLWPEANRIFSLTLITLLAACAAKPVVWQKTDVTVDEQRADMAQCRTSARADVDREFDRQQSYGGGFGGQSTYQKNMTAYQVEKNRDNLLARCMKLKGYRTR